MTNSKRDIEEVLNFRTDISPFLVHLTKDTDNKKAKEILIQIIKDGKLVAGESLVSDARFGVENTDDIEKYFKAVCFTETPLNEIYCLLEIKRRTINLQSYGLVFIKEQLKEKGVSPALYFNNYEAGNKDSIFQALCSLIQTHPDEAIKILPLIAVFGYHINKPNNSYQSKNEVNFSWEREWRYPNNNGVFKYTQDDIFIGLCPHEEIEEFEKLLPDVKFIDPMRNIKWYANKLVEARKRCDMKHSVV